MRSKGSRSCEGSLPDSSACAKPIGSLSKPLSRTPDSKVSGGEAGQRDLDRRLPGRGRADHDQSALAIPRQRPAGKPSVVLPPPGRRVCPAGGKTGHAPTPRPRNRSNSSAGGSSSESSRTISRPTQPPGSAAVAPGSGASLAVGVPPWRCTISSPATARSTPASKARSWPHTGCRRIRTWHFFWSILTKCILRTGLGQVDQGPPRVPRPILIFQPRANPRRGARPCS